MAYDMPCPEPLLVPTPEEIRARIRARMEEVRALRELLKLSEAAARVRELSGGQTDGRAD